MDRTRNFHGSWPGDDGLSSTSQEGTNPRVRFDYEKSRNPDGMHISSNNR